MLPMDDSIENMRTKEDETPFSSNLVSKESKQWESEPSTITQKNTTRLKECISPRLFAWSSTHSNKISIIGLETKEEVASFDGVKLNKNSDESSSWTYLKALPNTGYLVSVNHCCGASANLAIFDISRPLTVKKIYSFVEVFGSTGVGDITYNLRRNILGAISVGGKIAYHLFTLAKSNFHDNVNLVRKSRWHPQYSADEQNSVCSLDFDPAGEVAATIDEFGVCLISSVDTHDYRFHLNMEMTADFDEVARCRWSTNPSENLLYLKYDLKQLNILDSEKKTLIFGSPILLERETSEDLFYPITYSIDVCQSNGNLVASAGTENIIKVFDKRESKVIEASEKIHKTQIYCVRWDPSGNLLATASWDRTTKIVDFRTRKVLYTGHTSDKRNAMSVCFI